MQLHCIDELPPDVRQTAGMDHLRSAYAVVRGISVVTQPL
jgi:hypothetical protein